MKNRLLIALLFGTAILFISATRTYASEGTFELRSTQGKDTRCFVASLMMQDFNFRVLVSCRDLVYPAADDIFSYMLWATPEGGGNPIKLGQLAYGKAEFRTNKPFTGLFVTTEKDVNTKTPGNITVMRGTLLPITFLERPTTPTPTIQGQEKEQDQTQTLSTRERLLAGLKRAGLVSLLALVAVIGLVFVITRGRG